MHCRCWFIYLLFFKTTSQLKIGVRCLGFPMKNYDSDSAGNDIFVCYVGDGSWVGFPHLVRDGASHYTFRFGSIFELVLC